MTTYMMIQRQQRRQHRIHRVFRDRTHPLEEYSDLKVFKKFRLHRKAILDLCDSVHDDLEYIMPRTGSLTPVQQVLLALRFYATGAFQDVVGDLIGVSQSTVCRTVQRVTDALFKQAGREIRLPTPQEARRIKSKFFTMAKIPNVIGCVDGTHVRIQSPTQQEREYINRKGFHSINVQVICDADLVFINVDAKWPGSVHDEKMLRNSCLFRMFEGSRPPLKGIILGDNGYNKVQRSWLMTPVTHPSNVQERLYNFAHSSTLSTVERSIAMAKRRWHCLRCGMRLEPSKACRVITVCLMLHNRARRLNIPNAPSDSSDSDSDDDNSDSSPGNSDDDSPNHPTTFERARLASGKTARNKIINTCFASEVNQQQQQQVCEDKNSWPSPLSSVVSMLR